MCTQQWMQEPNQKKKTNKRKESKNNTKIVWFVSSFCLCFGFACVCDPCNLPNIQMLCLDIVQWYRYRYGYSRSYLCLSLRSLYILTFYTQNSIPVQWLLCPIITIILLRSLPLHIHFNTQHDFGCCWWVLMVVRDRVSDHRALSCPDLSTLFFTSYSMLLMFICWFRTKYLNIVSANNIDHVNALTHFALCYAPSIYMLNAVWWMNGVRHCTTHNFMLIIQRFSLKCKAKWGYQTKAHSRWYIL